MTKPRDATSIEDAVMACIGRLGSERAAEIAGKSASFLRQCSDPDNERQIAVSVALRLDLTMRLEGYGQPIFDAYAALLKNQPSGRASLCPMQAFLGIAKDLGPLADAVTTALSDGRIDPAEHREILRAGQAVMERVRALLEIEPTPLARVK